MLRAFKNVTARLICASFLLMMSALPALAQDEQSTATFAEEGSDWKALIIVMFFGLAIALGCFMTPKRTHQD